MLVTIIHTISSDVTISRNWFIFSLVSITRNSLKEHLCKTWFTWKDDQPHSDRKLPSGLSVSIKREDFSGPSTLNTCNIQTVKSCGGIKNNLILRDIHNTWSFCIFSVLCFRNIGVDTVANTNNEWKCFLRRRRVFSIKNSQWPSLWRR